MRVVAGNVYTGDGVLDAVRGADAVVSVLGQGEDSPTDLLSVAGENISRAMAETGVSRFVTLVGAGVREDGESVSLGGKMIGVLLKLLARLTEMQGGSLRFQSWEESDWKALSRSSRG